MDFSTLLLLTGSQADRDQWIRLAASLQQAAKRMASGDREAERESLQVLDEADAHLKKTFRALRHPLPSREELKSSLENAELPRE
jgi:hypothetical protein